MNLFSVGFSKYESMNDSVASENDARLIHQNFKRLFPESIRDDCFLITE